MPATEVPRAFVPMAGSRPPRALYIHYPFCVHRCHYCDFSVHRSSEPPFTEWLASIAAELGWWFDQSEWSPRVRLDTVFVGGGTPSLVPEDGPGRLRAVLDRWFVVDADTEWTIESNPASLSPSVARAWRRAGANRISIGVQAFDDAVLEWLGRLHDRARAEKAVQIAREAGFESASVDLIFGLPGEVERDLEAELEALVATGVDHVSAYGLTIEPRTPLAKWTELGRVTPTTGATYAEEYRLLTRLLRAAGYEHYEVSNFAKRGLECRHNWYYWNRTPYLGVGPSAHGFLPPFRVWNTFRWDRYGEGVRGGRGPVKGWESLDEEDVALERLWLGLRTREGVSPGDPSWRDGLGQRLDRWLDEGWVTLAGGRVLATVEGWLRLDELVSDVRRAET